jgi:hypothetical protein
MNMTGVFSLVVLSLTASYTRKPLHYDINVYGRCFHTLQ